jgi:hypothetical protein
VEEEERGERHEAKTPQHYYIFSSKEPYTQESFPSLAKTLCFLLSEKHREGEKNDERKTPSHSFRFVQAANPKSWLCLRALSC